MHYRHEFVAACLHHANCKALYTGSIPVAASYEMAGQDAGVQSSPIANPAPAPRALVMRAHRYVWPALCAALALALAIALWRKGKWDFTGDGEILLGAVTALAGLVVGAAIDEWRIPKRERRLRQAVRRESDLEQIRAFIESKSNEMVLGTMLANFGFEGERPEFKEYFQRAKAEHDEWTSTLAGLRHWSDAETKSLVLSYEAGWSHILAEPKNFNKATMSDLWRRHDAVLKHLHRALRGD